MASLVWLIIIPSSHVEKSKGRRQTCTRPTRGCSNDEYPRFPQILFYCTFNANKYGDGGDFLCLTWSETRSLPMTNRPTTTTKKNKKDGASRLTYYLCVHARLGIIIQFFRCVCVCVCGAYCAVHATFTAHLFATLADSQVQGDVHKLSTSFTS